MDTKSEIQLIGKINAVRTLIDNFPMNILDAYKSKKWTSVFDDLLEIAAALALGPKAIIQFLIKKLYNVVIPIRNGMFENIGNADYD